jgi:hypothetical protein
MIIWLIEIFIVVTTIASGGKFKSIAKIHGIRIRVQDKETPLSGSLPSGGGREENAKHFVLRPANSRLRGGGGQNGGGMAMVTLNVAGAFRNTIVAWLTSGCSMFRVMWLERKQTV